jgi:hypothetical protein
MLRVPCQGSRGAHWYCPMEGSLLGGLLNWIPFCGSPRWGPIKGVRLRESPEGGPMEGVI